jgi:hypothetical protein
MNLELALGVLKEGLKLWNAKEATKYLDKVIKLEAEYYGILSKPEKLRSQLALDKLLREFNSVAKNFVKYRSQIK